MTGMSDDQEEEEEEEEGFTSEHPEQVDSVSHLPTSCSKLYLNGIPEEGDLTRQGRGKETIGLLRVLQFFIYV